MHQHFLCLSCSDQLVPPPFGHQLAAINSCPGYEVLNSLLHAVQHSSSVAGWPPSALVASTSRKLPSESLSEQYLPSEKVQYSSAAASTVSPRSTTPRILDSAARDGSTGSQSSHSNVKVLTTTQGNTKAKLSLFCSCMLFWSYDQVQYDP